MDATTAPAARRVSTAKRQAKLRDWLLAGHTTDEVLHRAVAEFGIRLQRAQRDLTFIQSTWKDQTKGEGYLNYLYFSRLQHDRLLARALARLESCEDPKDELRLISMAHRLMKDRDSIMARIDNLSTADMAGTNLGNSLPVSNVPAPVAGSAALRSPGTSNTAPPHAARASRRSVPATLTSPLPPSADRRASLPPASADLAPSAYDTSPGPNLAASVASMPPEVRRTILTAILKVSSDSELQTARASALKHNAQNATAPSQQKAQPKDWPQDTAPSTIPQPHNWAEKDRAMFTQMRQPSGTEQLRIVPN